MPWTATHPILSTLPNLITPSTNFQLRQGPARRNRRRHQEDHEALLDPRVEQEDLPRVEAVEAFEARERESSGRFDAAPI
jgi:hypothetical protein